MEQEITVTLTFGRETLASLGRAAERAGRCPSAQLAAILRDALAPEKGAFSSPDKCVLRAIRLATDWLGLQRQLRDLGYVLRLAPSGGLMLHSWPDNRPILMLDDVGHSLTALMLRFRAPFPGDIRGRNRRALHPGPGGHLRLVSGM